MAISNDHLREEIIQTVSSPKWSCPAISKSKLSEVKKLLDFLVNIDSKSYFLEKCLTFNSLLKKQLFMSMNGLIA